MSKSLLYIIRKREETENIIDAVVLRPLHGLDATVMTVAAPHDAVVRPMRSQALRQVFDDGPHLGAFRVRAARRIATTGVPLVT